MELALTATDRADLERVVRATSTPAGLARRARCVLRLADGQSYSDELRLVHEHHERLQAEKEEQRRIREQMRDEEIAQRS